jgi:hypothetical protein
MDRFGCFETGKGRTGFSLSGFGFHDERKCDRLKPVLLDQL